MKNVIAAVIVLIVAAGTATAQNAGLRIVVITGTVTYGLTGQSISLRIRADLRQT